MSRRTLFDGERSVYWPTEFSDVVNVLKGIQPGNLRHPAFYKYNTGVLVLAAMVGFAHRRKRDVGNARQEINISTFEAHKLGDASLASFIFLVALLGGCELEALRSGSEDEVIRTFERYAAGGLQVLQEAFATSSDPTGLNAVLAEIERYIDASSQVADRHAQR